MAKYHQIVELVEKRILAGDYIARPFPHATVFAQEVGVSLMTARKVIDVLIEKGLLQKKSTGRIEVNQANMPHDITLALLTPAFESPLITLLRNQLAFVAKDFNAHVRNVTYVNWEDSIIPETIRGFDGTIIVPPARQIPVELLDGLTEEGNNFAIVFGDMSDFEVPSMMTRPQIATRLLDHLYRLGHRKIACLNSEPSNEDTVARIEQWELWTQLHDAQGELFDCPVENYGCPFNQAREVINAALDEGKFDSTALFCVSGSAAIGAIRAFHNHGIKVGEDVSVCSFDLPPGLGENIVPSLTAFVEPEYAPFLRSVIEWIDNDGKGWQGSYLYQPELELFEGESTDECPEISRVLVR